MGRRLLGARGAGAIAAAQLERAAVGGPVDDDPERALGEAAEVDRQSAAAAADTRAAAAVDRHANTVRPARQRDRDLPPAVAWRRPGRGGRRLVGPELGDQ